MKVMAERLGQALSRGLAPVYLVAGPERLLVLEACDRIRAACRQGGVAERMVLDAEGAFDWNNLGAATETGSLFAARRLVELRLPSGKPGREGGQALQDWIATAGDDILLLACNQWALEQEKAKWFKALESAGVYVPAWTVKPDRLPAWLQQRLADRGLSTDREGLRFLAARLEGNLLAAAQEIDRLALLHGRARLSLAELEAAVADSARFDAFRLVELALLGQAGAALRCARGLEAEGGAPVMIVAALARELETLEQFVGLRGSQGDAGAFRSLLVWKARQAPLLAAAQRLDAGRRTALVAQLSDLDCLAKGQTGERDPRVFWQELERLLLSLCAPGSTRRAA